jgi:predicted transglutaminase-like cysteine proteinase
LAQALRNNFAKEETIMTIKTATLTAIIFATLATAYPTRANEFVSWVWTPRRVPWNEITEIAKTPKEICALVRHHIKYQDDVRDNWQNAEETWRKGTGDCEDYAFAVKHLCEKLGYDVSIRVYYDKKTLEGHTVVVGKWSGASWISSNGSFEWVNDEKSIRKVNADILGIGKNDVASLKWYTMKPRDAATPMASSSSDDLILGAGPRDRIKRTDADRGQALPAFSAYYQIPYTDVPMQSRSL